MASHKQALKRHRQSIKRNVRNVHFKSKMKTYVKHVTDAVEEGDAEKAGQALKSATSIIDRVVQKGIIHPKTAARKISRLNKSLHRVKASKA